jgi:hypothetical protein
MSFIVPGVVLLLALLAICVLSGARRKPGGVIFHPLIRVNAGLGRHLPGISPFLRMPLSFRQPF